MRPEERIQQALDLLDAGIGMMQFDKNSAFAQALRELLAEVASLRAGSEPRT